MMIANLQNIVLRMEKLKKKEQKELAEWLEDELNWRFKFKETEDKLARAEDEAWIELEKGLATEGDW